MGLETYIKEIEPVAGGGTVSIDLGSGINLATIIPLAPITLTGLFQVTATGTPRGNMFLQFLYGGNITTTTASGFSIQILGLTLTDAQALAEALITARYNENTSSWDVMVIPSNEKGIKNIDGANLLDSSVTTAALADGAVTNIKSASLAQGSIKLGNASNVPSDLDMSGDSKILIGNGTTAAAFVLSGDVTMSASGVTTIGAGTVDAAMLSYTPVEYKVAKVELSAEQVLALYTSPVTCVAAPGVDKVNVIVEASIFLDYGVSTYASGGTMELVYGGAPTVSLWTAAATAITGGVDTFTQMTNSFGKLTTAVNETIDITNFTGLFITGNSSVTINIVYHTLDLS